MRGVQLTRRLFLISSTSAAGGLLLSRVLPPATAANAIADVHGLNPFLEIGPDEVVTIYAPVPEIGQGVRTSLPMLLAEELDCDWTRVRIVQAPASAQFGPRQRAAGSHSVRAYWGPLREAGASARAMLIAEASRRWNVLPASCGTRAGHVVHDASSRTATYGELAAAAAKLPVPEDIVLRSPREFRRIGKATRNVDCEDIATGQTIYGWDVRRPRMLYAVIARPPTYGGRVRSYEGADALRMPGVRAVFKLDASGDAARPLVGEGVVVVASSTWEALRGKERLRVDWELGPNTDESTQRLHALCAELVSRPADAVRNDGDIDAALKSARTKLDVTYHLPFLAHVCMEPPSCVAEVRKDRCVLWVPTQFPAALQAAVAARLKRPSDSVVVNVTHCGGGFGRRLSPDFTFEAVEIAQRVEAPVQLVWTREDDVQHDFYRPFSYHRLIGGLDDAGAIVAWLHRQAGTSRYAFRPNEKAHASEIFPNAVPAGLLENFRLEYALAESNLPRSLIRAPGHNALSFAVESFIDELAHAARADPLQFRLRLLGADREWPFDEDDRFSTARMKRVLTLAAEKAGWKRNAPRGSGRGIAAHFYAGTYVAWVAEVRAERAELHLERFVGAIDCGVPVNPAGIEAQMEGAVMDAAGAALHQEITFRGAQVEQSNFTDYPLLRMGEAPRVEVHIVPSHQEPTGVGEPPYPPVFPALTNAIYAATGIRVRKLPIRTQWRRMDAK
jgi:isoquinoline 1-oxidoreductase subunit beta